MATSQRYSGKLQGGKATFQRNSGQPQSGKATSQTYPRQLQSSETSIEKILKWAVTKNIKGHEKAKETYQKLLETRTIFSNRYQGDDVNNSASNIRENESKKVLEGTFTVPKDCKLYQIIQKALKDKISDGVSANIEYHDLRATEKLFQQLESNKKFPNKGPGKAVRSQPGSNNTTTKAEESTRKQQQQQQQEKQQDTRKTQQNTRGVIDTQNGRKDTQNRTQREITESKAKESTGQQQQQQKPDTRKTQQEAKGVTDTQKGREDTQNRTSRDSTESEKMTHGISNNKHKVYTNEVHDFPNQPRKREMEGEHSPSAIAESRISITKEKYDRLNQTIEIQATKIKELTNRLSKFASDQLLDGNPNIADLSDKNRPSKIGDKFSELYDNEWSDAFDVLSKRLKTDEEVLSTLMNILMSVYEFCKEMADVQLYRITDHMETTVTNLRLYRNEKVYEVTRPSKDPLHLAPTRKYAKDFRKETAPASVPALCELFCGVEFREKFPDLKLEQLPDCVTKYIHSCIELTWLMCIQDPPMLLSRQAVDTNVNTDVFKFFDKRGTVVKMTVWPAVYLHEGGPLVRKGCVLPYS